MSHEIETEIEVEIDIEIGILPDVAYCLLHSRTRPDQTIHDDR